MKKSRTKNVWVLLVLMLAGIVLGGFAGSLAQNVEFLNWLNYGKLFGISSPIVLDLGVLVFSFSFYIQFTIASVLGMILGIVIYRLI